MRVNPTNYCKRCKTLILKDKLTAQEFNELVTCRCIRDKSSTNLIKTNIQELKNFRNKYSQEENTNNKWKTK